MATALKGTRLNNSIGNRPRSMVSSRGPTKDNKLPAIKPGSANRINEPEIQYKTPANTAPASAGGHHGGIKLGQLNKSFDKGFMKQAMTRKQLHSDAAMEKNAFIGRLLGKAVGSVPKMVNSGGNLLSSVGNAALSGTKAIGRGAYNTGKFVVHDAPVGMYQGSKKIINKGWQGTKNFVAKERAAYDIARHPEKAMPVTSEAAKTVGPTKAELINAHKSRHAANNTVMVGDAKNIGPTRDQMRNSFRAQKYVSNATKGPVQFQAPNNGKFLNVSPKGAHDIKPTHRNSLAPRTESSVGNSTSAAHGAVGSTPNTVGSSPVVEKATTKQLTPAQQNAALRKETQGRPEKSYADRAGQYFNIGFSKAKKQWNKLTPGQQMGVVGAGALGTGMALRGGNGNQNNQQ